MVIKVLHVDDEEHCLELTREIMALYDKDLEIKSFTSPGKVIEKVKQNEPDLIISDYKMPEMNGIEFTKKLREHSTVPVIIYTGSDDESIAQEAFEAGVDDYVTKSDQALHYIVLLNRIKNAVDSYRTKRLYNLATAQV